MSWLQLWELLRMLALWGVPSRPGLASNRTSEQLCRIYLAFSLGLLQPLFYLLTLLLCQSSLRCALVMCCRIAIFHVWTKIQSLRHAHSGAHYASFNSSRHGHNFPDVLACPVCSPGRKRRQLGQERSAGSVLWLAAAGTLPMLAVQVVLAWFSKIFQSHGKQLSDVVRQCLVSVCGSWAGAIGYADIRLTVPDVSEL